MKGHEFLATARNNIVFSKGNYDNGKPFFDFACRTGIRAYGSRRPAGFDDERDAFSTVMRHFANRHISPKDLSSQV